MSTPMFLRKSHGPRTVTLPDGRILSHADLPAAGTRWVASRKAAVAEAVENGLLARSEAISRYGLTEEELDCWIHGNRMHGKNALKVTRLRKFRASDRIDL